MSKPCIHCGADEGLHHFDTLQCPTSGTEAPIGRKQTWSATTYQAPCDCATLRAEVARLTTYGETADSIIITLKTEQARLTAEVAALRALCGRAGEMMFSVNHYLEGRLIERVRKEYNQTITALREAANTKGA